VSKQLVQRNAVWTNLRNAAADGAVEAGTERAGARRAWVLGSCAVLQQAHEREPLTADQSLSDRVWHFFLLGWCRGLPLAVKTLHFRLAVLLTGVQP